MHHATTLPPAPAPGQPPLPPPYAAPRTTQVLVYHDLLGMMQHPHYVKVTPKFCKQYAAVGATIQQVRGRRAGGRACVRAGGGLTRVWEQQWLPHPPHPHPHIQYFPILPLPPSSPLPLPHPPRPPTPTPQALTAYHADVVSSRFPSTAFSPYRMPDDEAQSLLEALRRDEGLGAAAEAVAANMPAAVYS